LKGKVIAPPSSPAPKTAKVIKAPTAPKGSLASKEGTITKSKTLNGKAIGRPPSSPAPSSNQIDDIIEIGKQIGDIVEIGAEIDDIVQIGEPSGDLSFRRGGSKSGSVGDKAVAPRTTGGKAIKAPKGSPSRKESAKLKSNASKRLLKGKAIGPPPASPAPAHSKKISVPEVPNLKTKEQAQSKAKKALECARTKEAEEVAEFAKKGDIELAALIDACEMPAEWWNKPMGWMRKPDFKRPQQQVRGSDVEQRKDSGGLSDALKSMKKTSSMAVMSLMKTSSMAVMKAPYQKRWWELDLDDGVTLRYFSAKVKGLDAAQTTVRRQKMKEKAESGHVDLRDVSKVCYSRMSDAPEHALDLCGSERVYTVVPESKEEMVRWAKLVQTCCEAKYVQIPLVEEEKKKEARKEAEDEQAKNGGEEQARKEVEEMAIKEAEEQAQKDAVEAEEQAKEAEHRKLSRTSPPDWSRKGSAGKKKKKTFRPSSAIEAEEVRKGSRVSEEALQSTERAWDSTDGGVEELVMEQEKEQVAAQATSAPGVQETEEKELGFSKLPTPLDEQQAWNVKKGAEEQAKKEAKEQARKEAEEQAKKEAEEQARKEAEEQARMEAVEQQRKEAEEQARKEAEEQAKKEAEEQAKTVDKQAKAEEARLKKQAGLKKKVEEKKLQRAESKQARKEARKKAEEQAKKGAGEQAKKEEAENKLVEFGFAGRRRGESDGSAMASPSPPPLADLTSDQGALNHALYLTQQQKREEREERGGYFKTAIDSQSNAKREMRLKPNKSLPTQNSKSHEEMCKFPTCHSSGRNIPQHCKPAGSQ
jgi:hypothetical protein